MHLSDSSQACELNANQKYACNVFISQNGRTESDCTFHVLNMLPFMRYDGFNDDFGPLNMKSLMQFIENFDGEIEKSSPKDVVCSIGTGKPALTNACLLVGAYCVLKLDMEPEYVMHSILDLKPICKNYCDVSKPPSDFELKLIDCLNGLKTGKELGWIAVPSECCPGWSRWGKIYRDEYIHFDDPYNGDLHEVIPGKVIAFKGPVNLQGKKYMKNQDKGVRDFSPEYYVDVFRVLGVSTIIRLNEVQYDASAFTSSGFQHKDLFFQDCTSPPAHILDDFAAAVDAAPGIVAVHCKSGIGRSGTVIAYYMMRRHGFTARAAMGWLRIMRPGSVIGPQQHFLCAVEAFLSKAKEHRESPALARQSNSHTHSRACSGRVGNPLDDATRVAPELRPLQRTITPRAGAGRRTDQTAPPFGVIGIGRCESAPAAAGGGAGRPLSVRLEEETTGRSVDSFTACGVNKALLVDQRFRVNSCV